jgi:hypothetical protein
MNGYEIVNKIMQEGRYYMSENELRENCGEEYPIVIAILKNKYKGRYCESWDSRCCGSWHWENPLLSKKTVLVLYYHLLDNTKLNFKPVMQINKKDGIDYLIDEIIGIEEPFKMDKEKIKKDLLTNSCFKGKKRLWIVNEEQSY